MSEEHTSNKPTDAIRFTDREAVRLIETEAAKTGEPLAKVASRIIVKFFAARDADRKPSEMSASAA